MYSNHYGHFQNIMGSSEMQKNVHYTHHRGAVGTPMHCSTNWSPPYKSFSVTALMFGCRQENLNISLSAIMSTMKPSNVIIFMII